MERWTHLDCGCQTDGAGRWLVCDTHLPEAKRVLVPDGFDHSHVELTRDCFCRYEVTPVMCPAHGVMR